jgi:glutamate racemase
MQTDLLAGTVHVPATPLVRAPTILVFDSGVGGLTVHAELRRARPDARFIYAADDAGFPYGRLDEGAVVARVVAVMDRLVEAHAPDLVVVACNTASTLVLPSLRAAHAIPFVGTVPAVKPASERTRSGMFSVLATPGTVRRDYTQALVHTYAYHRDVTLVGAPGLAALAEAALRGESVADAAFAAEAAPAFVERDGRRTDTVVLACTHYPLVADRLAAVAPWPVAWIDPAPAIARRAASLLPPPADGAAAGAGRAVFTGPDEDAAALARVLAPFGLADVAVAPRQLAPA